MEKYSRPSKSRDFKASSQDFDQRKTSLWNQRFTVEKTPAYDSVNDPHLKFFIHSITQKKFLNPLKLKSSLVPVRLKTRNTTLQSKSKALQELIIEYQKASQFNKIDDKVSELFLTSLKSLKISEKIKLLISEIKLISTRKSKSMLVLNYINQREGLIAEIKSRIVSGPVNKKTIDEYYLDSFSRLRNLSISTLISISDWKEYLSWINPLFPIPPDVKYFWKGENYLAKMNSDLYFLTQCQLSEFFNFSAKNDPFLAYPSSLNVKTTENRYVIPLKPFDLQHLRFCELKLMEESVLFSEKPLNPSTSGLYLNQIRPIKGSIYNQILDYNKNSDKTFGFPLEDYSKSLSYNFPLFFWWGFQGLLMLAVPKQVSAVKILTILHLSGEKSQYLLMLGKVVGFVSENFKCDEIRIEIASSAASGGKYETHEVIKNALNELGFRWKKIISRENSPSVIVFYKKIESGNWRNLEIFEDSLQIEYEYKGGISQTNPKYSYLGAVALKESNSLEKTKLLAKAPKGFIPPLFFTENKENSLHAISKLSISFENFHVCIYKNFRFLHVFNTKASVFMSEKGRGYILPTQDESISSVILFSETTSNPTEKIIQALQTIKVSEVIPDLCIPGFRINEKTTSETLKIFLNTGPSIEGLYSADPCQHIISKSFIFSLIHSKIDEVFEIPYLSVYIDQTTFSKLLLTYE